MVAEEDESLGDSGGYPSCLILSTERRSWTMNTPITTTSSLLAALPGHESFEDVTQLIALAAEGEYVA